MRVILDFFAIAKETKNMANDWDLWYIPLWIPWDSIMAEGHANYLENKNYFEMMGSIWTLFFLTSNKIIPWLDILAIIILNSLYVILSDK